MMLGDADGLRLRGCLRAAADLAAYVADIHWRDGKEKEEIDV